MVHALRVPAAAVAALSAAPILAQPCSPGWTPFVVGGGSPDLGVEAILTYSDPSGEVLIIGGMFETVAGLSMGRIARYQHGQWFPLGSGIPFPFNSRGYNGCCAGVKALATAPTGPNHLYIGGDFIQSGGVTTESIARWDGASWHDLAGGLSFNPACMDCPPRVMSLVPAPTGGVYVIGSFEFAGGASAMNIARWDGASFNPLGEGLTRRPGEFLPSWGSAAVLFDDGAGSSLFVAGHFALAGQTDALNIARWDGQQWHAVGGGITQPVGGPTPAVHALTVFDVGSGDRLYAAGYFLEAAGSPARHIASWNGQTWEALGAGIGDNPNDQVFALFGFDDGEGPALYAGGRFEIAGGVPAQNIARWRSGQWEALGSGVDNEVRTFGNIEEGGQRSLLVGGWFTTAGGFSSPYLAAWRGCTACRANCDASTIPPVLNIDDFTCFLNEFAGAQGLPHAQQVEHYSNCDGSTVAPALNVDDFTCFINEFAAGCP